MLHNDKRRAFVIACVINFDNGRGIKLLNGCRFQSKALAELRLVDKGVQHDFDGHGPIIFEIVSAVDHPHAAFAEQGFYLVLFYLDANKLFHDKKCVCPGFSDKTPRG